MILCDSEIRAALKNGQLVIDPAPAPDAVGPSSVDLTLGGEFHRWKPVGPSVTLSVDSGSPGFKSRDIEKDWLEAIKPEPDGSIVLKKGDFILGATAEKVKFPVSSRLAARVEGRSSLARLGLGIHVTAPTIHASFGGVIVLEIWYVGTLPIRLRPGMGICQLIIEQVFGTPSRELGSAFQNQQSVTG